ncbi:MAG: hypothetical protein F2536_02865 [Actinobacteria bacterium]|uniref:Unannotated protein n=1 Tax=freshwater metagenome TaxID=449393 RepID=A0A6J6C3R5_9ZZZZ|nr:hypothetical protein [Actinomycetota bacterium]MTA89852.1 hypothetical protein [Actinomycetota bacterium]
MTIRIRRRVSPWTLFLGVAAVSCAVLIFMALNKPLPTYLVAKRDLVAGELIVSEDVESVALDLGPLADRYASALSEGKAVRSAIGAGELIPLSRLGSQFLDNQTAVRLIPSTQPSASVIQGSFVSVWQVVEVAGGFEPQQLVDRAEVAAVKYGEGLFAEEIPEVELLLGKEQAMLVITALAADFEVFVLPTK